VAHPFHHALSSVQKHGGQPEDDQAIHDWFDQTKAHLPDARHRAILHSSFEIFLCEQVFGATITNSDGKVIPVRARRSQLETEHQDFLGSLEAFCINNCEELFLCAEPLKGRRITRVYFGVDETPDGCTVSAWGFLIAIDALIPPSTLLAQRRAACRWIGLNALEPSITTLLSVGIVLCSTNSAFSGAWFALPLITFFALLLLPLFMRSRGDVAIRQVQRRLRQIFLARVAPLILVVLGLALDQTWLAFSAVFIGLVALGWCWLMLSGETTRLRMQPAVAQERTIIDVA
jgi:hypothetical protein